MFINKFLLSHQQLNIYNENYLNYRDSITYFITISNILSFKYK